jgi:hypothetical protein
LPGLVFEEDGGQKAGRGAVSVDLSKDQLSGVPWSGEFWYRVLSYYFCLRWNADRLGSFAHQVLEGFTVPRDPGEERTPPTPGDPPVYSLLDVGPSEQVRYRLVYRSSVMAAGEDAGYVLDQLFWHVNSEAVRHTGDFLLIHAGALATPTGEGVLLPAPSGHGKTTLVAGLVQAGFGYLSDEAGAVDPVTRKLYPYPKALSLSRDVLETHFPDLADRADGPTRKRYLPPDWLRPAAVAEPCLVRFVIVHRFQSGASTTITPISRGNAALELGRNAMNLGVYRERALPLLSDLVLGAACYQMVHGSLAEAVVAICGVTGSRPPDQLEKTPSSLEAKSPL